MQAALGIVLIVCAVLGLIGLVMILYGVGLLFQVAKHPAPTRAAIGGDGKVIWHEWTFRRGVACVLIGVGVYALIGVALAIAQVVVTT